MKDILLRDALGIHGTYDLCVCDIMKRKGEWAGEIPELWHELKRLQKRIEELEKKNE